jgi:zinc protease
MRLSGTLAVGLIFATVMAPVAAARPAVTDFRLANGMEVVVIEDHRAPVVTHMVWYRVGAADEPRGHSGIAHFFEHLMFKSTKKVAEGAFS